MAARGRAARGADRSTAVARKAGGGRSRHRASVRRRSRSCRNLGACATPKICVPRSPIALRERRDLTLTHVVRRGVRVMVARDLVIRVVTMAGGLVMAILLGPAAFGVWAVGLGLVAALQAMTRSGLGATLLRRAEAPTQGELNALFTFSAVFRPDRSGVRPRPGVRAAAGAGRPRTRRPGNLSGTPCAADLVAPCGAGLRARTGAPIWRFGAAFQLSESLADIERAAACAGGGACGVVGACDGAYASRPTEACDRDRSLEEAAVEGSAGR